MFWNLGKKLGKMVDRNTGKVRKNGNPVGLDNLLEMNDNKINHIVESQTED